jgi:L-aminopeptidase/D-esterase-like protein
MRIVSPKHRLCCLGEENSIPMIGAFAVLKPVLCEATFGSAGKTGTASMKIEETGIVVAMVSVNAVGDVLSPGHK